MEKQKKAVVFRAGLSVLLAAMLAISGCSKQAAQTASSNASSSETSSTTRVITDMDGNKVTIPSKVTRVATSWPGFCNAIFTVTGSTNKIVATNSAIKNYPWAMKIYPSLKNIQFPFGGTGLNAEQLIQAKPDVAFLRSDDGGAISQVKQAGIPVVMISYKHNNMQDVIDSVLLTGKILGGNDLKRAQSYEKYFQANLKKVAAATANIPQDKKTKIIYMSVQGGISVWGKNLPQQESIAKAGAINVAADSVDRTKTVSVEQLLAWNPDVIVVDGNLASSNLAQNPAWQQLSAVKNNKVYTCPSGVFGWARLGSESALQVLWLGKTIYPDRFKDVNLEKETMNFYKTYFGYTLTKEQADLILAGKSPQG